MIFFQQFYLDKEKDIAVDLRMEGDRLFYTIRTPNHHSGNLITNLAKLCDLKAEFDDQHTPGKHQHIMSGFFYQIINLGIICHNSSNSASPNVLISDCRSRRKAVHSYADCAME